MKKIRLSNGGHTLVDDEDHCKFKHNTWYGQTSPSNGKRYVVRNTYINRSVSSSRLHREIVNAPRGMDVDHINGNTLDNRKANLRICTRSENNCNSNGRSNRKSQYKGVYFDKSRNKWMARLKFAGVKKMFRFKSEIEAAIAYNFLACHYHGEFKRLNEVHV